MDFIKAIAEFTPQNEQEASDQAIILDFAGQFKNTLLRENEVAHITSSGFIMNPDLDQALLIHHNIRGVWAWTGGHADGDPDLLGVALREAKEETGVARVAPLSERIASIDILPVFGHVKNGKYVSAHLHLSVSYILICGKGERLRVKPDENTDVKWFDTGLFTAAHFDVSDVYLYGKLIARARRLGRPII